MSLSAAAQGLPAIAYPTAPLKGELPLYRRASGNCLQVVGWRAVAGHNRKGQSGYAHLADCRTGAGGPGMVVTAGWSIDPKVQSSWLGGPVSGVIGPDSRNLLRLVSAEGLGGLDAALARFDPQQPSRLRGAMVPVRSGRAHHLLPRAAQAVQRDAAEMTIRP